MLQLGPADAHVSLASRIAGRCCDTGAGKTEEEVGIDELQRVLYEQATADTERRIGFGGPLFGCGACCRRRGGQVSGSHMMGNQWAWPSLCALC
jgi:hypothetical protein